MCSGKFMYDRTIWQHTTWKRVPKEFANSKQSDSFGESTFFAVESQFFRLPVRCLYSGAYVVHNVNISIVTNLCVHIEIQLKVIAALFSIRIYDEAPFKNSIYSPNRQQQNAYRIVFIYYSCHAHTNNLRFVRLFIYLATFWKARLPFLINERIGGYLESWVRWTAFQYQTSNDSVYFDGAIILAVEKVQIQPEITWELHENCVPSNEFAFYIWFTTRDSNHKMVERAAQKNRLPQIGKKGPFNAVGQIWKNP